MVGLMSKEEADYCARVVYQLRMEVNTYNVDLALIDSCINDELDPPTFRHRRALMVSRGYLLGKRNFSAKMIQDIREVLVDPPSLESRVFGYINRVLSFRYI